MFIKISCWFCIDVSFTLSAANIASFIVYRQRLTIHVKHDGTIHIHDTVESCQHWYSCTCTTSWNNTELYNRSRTITITEDSTEMYEYYSKQCQFYLDVFFCIDIFIFTHNADIIQVRDQAIVMFVPIILQTTFDSLIKCTECQKA